VSCEVAQASFGRVSDGPTAPRFEAVHARAAAAGARKGRDRSCLAASRPDLIVPDPVGPLRVGRAGDGCSPWGVASWPSLVEAFACYRAEVIRPRPIWAMLEFGNPTDR